MREALKYFEGMSREEILATRPGLWDDYNLLDVIQHFEQKKDWDRAAAIMELILRSPEHSDTVDYGELYFRLVEYYKAHRQDFAAALRWAHAMIAYLEQHEPGMNRMNAWRDLGEVYLQGGDFNTGLAMFARILRADPEDIWTYNTLGFELRFVGLYQLAIEALDQGLRLVEQDDPELLKDQLTRFRHDALKKRAQGKDRLDEVDPGVLAAFRDALALVGERGRSHGDVEALPYLSPLDRLLSLGPARDDAVYTETLNQGKVLAPELIRMAFDPELHEKPADDPAHHAPAHAVALLRALRGEVELGELTGWLDNADGDWFTELLTTSCGKIGGYTTDQLKALAADTTYAVYARSAAIDALAERAGRVPAQREQIVEFMRYLLNRPEAYEKPEEETFIGFLITSILDMDARELYQDVKRAYDEDRVDTGIVGLGDVHHEWGLKPLPRPRRRDGLYMRLRCKECGRVREHFVEHVLVDTITLRRVKRGEEVPYDPHVMDRKIICPKCGAVDRYEMTPMAYLALLDSKVMPDVFLSLLRDQPPTQAPYNSRVHLFQSYAFGRPMHPLAALEEYRRRIAKKPEDAGLYFKMGNLLRTLGRHSEALDSYRRACELNPRNAEMALALAMCAHDLGDRETARAMYERVRELSLERRGWLRNDISEMAAVAADGLIRLRRGQSSPWSPPWEVEGASVAEGTGEGRSRQAASRGKARRRKGKRKKKRRR